MTIYPRSMEKLPGSDLFLLSSFLSISSRKEVMGEEFEFPGSESQGFFFPHPPLPHKEENHWLPFLKVMKPQHFKLREETNAGQMQQRKGCRGLWGCGKWHGMKEGEVAREEDDPSPWGDDPP